MNSPPKTILFPVQLIAYQTAEVESFPSYLYRLAFDHEVYVGELMRFVYRMARHDGILDINLEEPKHIQPNELVRPYGMTNMLVSMFEYATGAQLRAGVFQFLNGAVGKSSGEIVHGVRWCPECLREMSLLNREPYFKLIWHLSSIKACPVHRTPLVEKCEACNCLQTSYVRRRPLQFCQDCGVDLSIRQNRLSASDIASSWIDIGFDVILFFKDMAENKYAPLPENGLLKSLDKIFDFYWTREREEEFYSLLSRNELLMALDGNHSLSLLSVRRIAHKLGVPIYLLLSGDGEFSDELLNMSRLRSSNFEIFETDKKIKKNHQDILLNIASHLRAASIPLSISELASKVGVSVGYLEYRHPSLVADLVAKHQAYEQQQRLKKIYYAQRAALEFFLDEKYAYAPKSRKQAYKTIREETGLPKHLLRRAIQTAYAAVFGLN